MIEILRWLAILIVAALRERGDLALEIWLATTAGNAEKEEGSPETPQERPRVLGGALCNLAPLAKRPCTWSRRTRWSDGSEKASGSIGPGFRGGEVQADRKRVWKLEP